MEDFFLRYKMHTNNEQNDSFSFIRTESKNTLDIMIDYSLFFLNNNLLILMNFSLFP